MDYNSFFSQINLKISNTEQYIQNLTVAFGLIHITNETIFDLAEITYLVFNFLVHNFFSKVLNFFCLSSFTLPNPIYLLLPSLVTLKYTSLPPR